jgi:hypothetical protein
MTVDALKKYKESCYSALSRDLTEFEKNFLFISGGILAFSITFIKDIIKVSEANLIFFLFLSWALIIASIGIMMHTFLKSASASDQLWKIVDNFINENDLYDDSKELSTDQCKKIKAEINDLLHPCKSNLKNLRNWAVNFFLAGIVFFSAFVSYNLVKEQNHIETPNSIKTVFVNDTIILIKSK